MKKLLFALALYIAVLYEHVKYRREQPPLIHDAQLPIDLRPVPDDNAIIEHYRRRESSVEEALIEMYLAFCMACQGYNRGFMRNPKYLRAQSAV